MIEIPSNPRAFFATMANHWMADHMTQMWAGVSHIAPMPPELAQFVEKHPPKVYQDWMFEMMQQRHEMDIAALEWWVANVPGGWCFLRAELRAQLKALKSPR